MSELIQLLHKLKAEGLTLKEMRRVDALFWEAVVPVLLSEEPPAEGLDFVGE